MECLQTFLEPQEVEQNCPVRMNALWLLLEAEQSPLVECESLAGII